MKLIKLIPLIICFISIPTFANNYEIAVCDTCTISEMKNTAISMKKDNGSVEVQVADPSSGVVAAYRVISVSEPGFESVDIFSVEVREEVQSSALEAKAVLDSMAVSAKANQPIVDRAKSIYNFRFFDRVAVSRIPITVANSAREIALGSSSHLSVSQHLGPVSIEFSSGLTDVILSAIATYTVAVFEDGSIIILKGYPFSSIQWEPFGSFFIDENGDIIELGNASSGGSGGSAGGGGEGGNPGLLGTISLPWQGTGGGGGGTEWCFVQNDVVIVCWIE